ncbi:MAG: hypothetical protein MJ097_00450 [Dorea sp.]|nr:hypothetical protein [Dorea sp.]
MRKDIAFQSYLEDFMRIAYPSAPVAEDDYYLVYAKTSVPDDAILPYLTYEFVDADFLDGDVSIEVDLWNRTESEAEMNRVAREFRHYINNNDLIACDEGKMWIKAGNPFSSPIPIEGEANGLKGRMINLTIEHLTR